MRTCSSCILVPAIVLSALVFGACAQQSSESASNTGTESSADVDTRSSAEGAISYIISPADGATIESPFLVQFGLTSMGVAPAAVEVANTGHHHLLIDVDELPSMDEPLPTTENMLHFGAGQTETVLDLPPGTHTLQLVLGNFAHIPHDPPVISEKITIEVIE